MSLYDSIKPTPRNMPMGLLADGLLGAQRFAEKPFGYDNPPAAAILNMLGIPALARTIDEMSYGGALGTGKGMTWKPKEDTIDAAMVAAPLAIAAAPVVAKGVTNTAKWLAPKAGQMAENYMVKTGGRLGIVDNTSTNLEDAKAFAEKVQSSGKQFVPKIIEDGGGSVYVTVSKAPLTKTGDIAKNRNSIPLDFKARFADHPSYWGSTISSDPITRNTVDDAFAAFSNKHLGTELPSKNVSARFDPRDKTGVVTELIDRGYKPSLSGKSMVRDVETQNRPFSLLNNHPNNESLLTILERNGVPLQKPFEYPQAKALETARQNGVKMLGLPENNTAMDRAKALGFDTEMPLLHGTGADIRAFDPRMEGKNDMGLWGKGQYLTTSPASANSYALRQGDGANVIPAYVAVKNPMRVTTGSDFVTRMPDGTNTKTLIGYNLDGSKIKEIAKSSGHDGIFQVKPDGNIGDIVTFNPASIRSRFAAFDPARVNESDLLAGALPFTAMIDEENRAALDARLKSIAKRGGLLGK